MRGDDQIDNKIAINCSHYTSTKEKEDEKIVKSVLANFLFLGAFFCNSTHIHTPCMHVCTYARNRHTPEAGGSWFKSNEASNRVDKQNEHLMEFS